MFHRKCMYQFVCPQLYTCFLVKPSAVSDLVLVIFKSNKIEALEYFSCKKKQRYLFMNL